MRNLIIYESKYGSTKKCTDVLAKVIGYSKIITPKEFNPEECDYDNFIIAAPIYNETIPEAIMNFIIDNKDLLISKRVYGIAVSLSGNAENYLSPVKDILQESLVMMKSVYGDIIKEKLDKKDYESLEKFYELISQKFESTKKYDIYKTIETALEIKADIDGSRKKLDESIVQDIVMRFINDHNTCVLSSAYQNEVRATPIEYIFYDEFLYFISEGGVKFANILRNNKVSIGIFDDFESMIKVSGLQIMGTAEIVDLESDEYFNVLSMKKIDKETYYKLNVQLNVIKVKMYKIEALNTEFKRYGGDVKQQIEI